MHNLMISFKIDVAINILHASIITLVQNELALYFVAMFQPMPISVNKEGETYL